MSWEAPAFPSPEAGECKSALVWGATPPRCHSALPPRDGYPCEDQNHTPCPRHGALACLLFSDGPRWDKKGQPLASLRHLLTSEVRMSMPESWGRPEGVTCMRMLGEPQSPIRGPCRHLRVQQWPECHPALGRTAYPTPLFLPLGEVGTPFVKQLREGAVAPTRCAHTGPVVSSRQRHQPSALRGRQ